MPIVTTDKTTIRIRLRHESATRRATPGRFRLALSAGPAWPDDAARGGTVEESVIDPATEYRGLPESLANAIASSGDLLKTFSGGARQRAGGPTPVRTQDIVETFYQLSTPELATLAAEVARLESAKARLEMGVTRVMVSEAMATPRETRILPRGNWMDDSGAVVDPVIREFLWTTGDPVNDGRLASILPTG